MGAFALLLSVRVYPVDKPLNLTSHDVVARARRLLGTRRVGHAGTLDPLATGVLTLLVGEATKLSPYLTAADKHYLAWVALGAGTPTLDAEGPITARADEGALSTISPSAVEAAAGEFMTVTSQRPPAFSAVKQEGTRSYADARQGRITEPPERPVAYHQAKLLAFAPQRDALPQRFTRTPAGWRPDPAGREFELPPVLKPLPTALFALTVGAGTYVRAFARDLGAALGVPAHLAGLVRTGAGGIDLADCNALDELAEAPGLEPLLALSQPKLLVDAPTARAVRQGKQVSLPVTGVTMLHEEDGALVAMVEPRGTSSVGPVRILRAWQR